MEKNIEESVEVPKKKKKFFKDQKNIAIAILSILLLINITSNSSENGANVTTSSDLTSSLSEKEATIKVKEEQIENLQNTHETLRKEKQDLLTEKERLEQEKQNLENEKSTLAEENKNLNTQIESLKRTSSTQSTAQNNNTATSARTTSTQDTNSTIVYVTKTGDKYHKANCSYLKKSKIEMTLSNAKAQGYTPCSRCY